MIDNISESKAELKELLDSYSKLSKLDQEKELENKIKSLIGILNEINTDKELLLIPRDHLNNVFYLTNIYSLICCLENEIAKLLEKNFK